MAILDLGKVVMRGASAMMKQGPNIKLDLRLAAAPADPRMPPGTFAWSVVEHDLKDDTEEIVVGGFAPSAQEGAMLGAMALLTELQRRRS
jgi:hypothetical protein